MQTSYSTASNARRAGNTHYGPQRYTVVQVGSRYFVQEVETEAELVTADPAPWQWPTSAAHAAGPQRPAKRGRPAISEVRNGARKPVAGVCATLWAHFDTLEQATVAAARAFAEANKLNLSNATQEFYAWRKFHANV